MSPGQHADGSGAFGRSAGGAMVRGVVLIIVAVALGIVLLRATDAPEPFANAIGGDGAGQTTTSRPAGVPQTSTTASTVPAVDPSTITVLVANGAGVGGLAAKLTEQVEGEGFEVATPTDAEDAEKSTIYFAPGFEEAATAVAALFDPKPAVAPLPDPPPVDDLQGANLVLVAAADLAE